MRLPTNCASVGSFSMSVKLSLRVCPSRAHADSQRSHARRSGLREENEVYAAQESKAELLQVKTFLDTRRSEYLPTCLSAEEILGFSTYASLHLGICQFCLHPCQSTICQNTQELTLYIDVWDRSSQNDRL